MNYAKLKKKLFNRYLNPNTPEYQRKLLEQWADTICDSNANNGGVICSERVTEMPEAVAKFLDEKGLILRSRNLCKNHLDMLIKDMKEKLGYEGL